MNYIIKCMHTLCVVYSIIYPATATAENAGIIPYAYKNGQPYILLGLEHRSWDKSSWAQNARKNKISLWVWSDFGGKCDVMSDEKAAQKKGVSMRSYCAARECAEETRYVFGNYSFNQSIDYLLNHIQQKFSIPPTGKPYYYLYFAHVDYIDAATFNRAPKVPHYEKERYEWFTVEHVLNALQKPGKNNFYRFAQVPSGAQSDKMFPVLARTLRTEEVNDYLQYIAKSTAAQSLHRLMHSINQLQHSFTNLLHQMRNLPIPIILQYD